MIQKITIYFFGFVLLYFVGGGILFNHVFLPKPIDYPAYFEKHQQFASKEEGMQLSIKKLDAEKVFLKMSLEPYAEGPPEHIHQNFDEFFAVEKGTLSLLINGQKRTLKAGESILIPKGTPHKPFNETDQVVILNDCTDIHPTMPSHFAYGLSQLYPVMDKHGAKSPKVLLKLAVLGFKCDTWMQNPPIFVQKTIRWLLSPSARIISKMSE
ncbi:cupin domain-containing protein [Lacihabitans sp. CCS-44]|uniref:cupin domain-containing protein n=1 Tax=Lacihabitans sp. CCS-44 TaxID=2487331 RepID=UPI0020CE31F7|nr:cupin domain-containing protein [Lacihabitans sp. CCS-44]MCP9756630.1 cupin domain-containing protein [Lacihabitans sp. CCS-44]